MEGLVFSLSVAIIGVLVVFVGLTLLIFCIKAITAIVGAGEKKPKTQAVEKASAPAVSAPVATPVVQEGIPAEVVAAITAAIATMWEGDKGFVVRHVRRINNAPAWNRAGREEQTYSHF